MANNSTRKNHKKPTCVMLINDIARLAQEQLRARGTQENLKNTYLALLHIIGNEDGLSQLEIANRVHLAPPTVSITLQKMERDGLICREPDPQDLRQVKVHLTEKGGSMNDVINQAARQIDKAIMKDITQEEIDTIYPILLKMRDNVMEE